MISVDITKQLYAGAHRIAMQLQVEISDGEVLALFGPSGSGKTSAMRMIAGLLPPDEGRLVANGVPWYDSAAGINRVPQQRDVSVVFQDYALFPNMTVRENVLYAMKGDQSPAEADAIIDRMELTPMRDVRPALLSGGQKQRAALARALARRSRVLLLDEPTSALDAALRVRVQECIKAMHAEYGLSTLLITHDMGEVARLADRVVVIEEGRQTAHGLPHEVWPHG